MNDKTISSLIDIIIFFSALIGIFLHLFLVVLGFLSTALIMLGKYDLTAEQSVGAILLYFCYMAISAVITRTLFSYLKA